MRILLAEDNRDLSEWVSRLLRQSHYVVDCVHRGDEADAALQSQSFDLVILDLGLPDLDGIEVLRRLRRRADHTPVLILTANDAVSSRVKGLDAGADDYLVKPFEVEELEARIRAQLRRGRSRIEQVVSYGDLALDSQSRAFSLKGAPLALTPREHAVLEALILNAGRPVPKERLVENVFGFDDEAGPSAVEVYVHRVRKKLEGSDAGIITLRGLGYMLRRADVA